MKEQRFPLGGIGEENEFFVRFDVQADSRFGAEPCKHALGLTGEKNERTWTLRRTVVSATQGGNDETEICADCILEALTP